MNQPTMKIVGGRNLPAFWDRFDRLQRTAHLLLGRGICPKGVFRFKTFQEFEEWKNRLRQEPPNKAT
jgi:hypothetical protein